METQKTILFAALFFLSYVMWQSWHQTFPDKYSSQPNSEKLIITTNSHDSSLVPSVVNNVQNNTNSNVNNANINDDKLITVKTDVIEYKINLVGGDIVQTSLLEFKKVLTEDLPMTLLNYNRETLYTAANGLTGTNGPDTQDSRAVYTSDKNNYELSPESSDLVVNLILTDSANSDIKITKSFIFKRGQYDMDVVYNIDNNTSKNWSGNIFSVLKRKNVPSESSSFLSPSSYSGLAVYDQENKFRKLPSDKLLNTPQNWATKEGWAATIQHYFLSAWIPSKNENYKYIAKANNDDTYTVTLVGPEIVLSPGQKTTTEAMKFYSGPEQADKLDKLAVGLNRTVDYGIMWPIASIIFLAMKAIHSVVGNWGWAIILVTILIKLLFYRLSSSSYRSMAKLRILAPKIEQLRSKCGDDKEKMGKAMMELYKKEKVNPLGGCLPMLIQLPFFIALYWVIIESVELRHAPFGLWIQDLSVKDPYFILPIIMGLAMLGQQRLSPAPADPTQAKVMMMMPVMFTVLFIYFPAGLVLYWVVNTITSIMQQWWISRKIDLDKNSPNSSSSKKKDYKSDKLDIKKLAFKSKPINDSSYS